MVSVPSFNTPPPEDAVDSEMVESVMVSVPWL
jgi:hypothetical protein